MQTENQSNELTVLKEDVQISNVPSVFGNKATFEHAQRVAVMLAKSDLVPATFKDKTANVMIALELANRVGASPFMVMQNLSIIHGKPSWSSQFLIATLNASGRFTSIRYEEDDRGGGRTRAFAKDKSSGEMCYGAWVSMEMAKAEGWLEKNGSKWKTMPEVMRRYRAASFFTKQFAPEVSMGIQTYEEAQDITNYYSDEEPANGQTTQEAVAEVAQKETESDRFLKAIQNCDSLEKLNKNRKALSKFPEHTQAFSDKEDELTNQTADV